MVKKTNGRRSFVKKSIAVAAGITIVPRHVLGGPNFMAPSDQLTKAVIGVGGMGQGHLNYEGTRLLAVCDADGKHLQQTLQKVGGGVKGYRDFEKYYKDLILILFILQLRLIGTELCLLWQPKQVKMYGVKNL